MAEPSERSAGRMEDDAEILFFIDRDDGNFGCALNVTNPQLSE